METKQVTVEDVPVSVKINKKTKSKEWFGVCEIVTQQGRLVYGAQPDNKLLPSIHATARAAAKAVDIILIKQGKDPVNILKPVAK